MARCNTVHLFLHFRIVILSSLAHGGAKEGISFDDINFEESFQTMQVYSQSKLANILHAKELARRLEGTGVSVYALHPGVIATELGRHLKGGKIIILRSTAVPD